jgi:peptidoglycan/xylan/chitin deacetylase (PgdA/CDA1 family)
VIARLAKRLVPDRLVPLLGRPLAYLLIGIVRWSDHKAGVALAYHAVAPAGGDPARELVPAHSAAMFEAQLRHVRALHRVVPAASLREAALARRRGQRFPVAITFDDDLRSHREAAPPILDRLELPATFFLCGASLSAPFSFWWERLQRAVDRGAVPAGPEGIHARGREIQALASAERDRVAEELLAQAGPDPEEAGLRAQDVRDLAAAGHEIGFHTRRHDFLPPLDDDALARAMRDGRRELAEASGTEPVAIAYPHGGGDARVAAAARAAGFRLGFTTSEQAVWPDSEPFLLGRLQPSLRSTGDLALRVAQLLAARRPARGQ